MTSTTRASAAFSITGTAGSTGTAGFLTARACGPAPGLTAGFGLRGGLRILRGGAWGIT